MSTHVDEWPPALAEVIKAARKEMTSHMEAKQYKLYNEADGVEAKAVPL